MWEIYLIGVKVAVILNLIYFALRCYYDKAYHKSYPSWTILIPLIYSTIFLGFLSWVGVPILVVVIYNK